MSEMLRLDKFLVEMQCGTRSQMKEAAKKGRIMINGMVTKKTDIKIDPELDEITFDRIPVQYARYEYYMLNKPKDVVSATEDHLHATVIDLIETSVRADLFPVGRLDIDTEGLLLITNDGILAHNLLSPKHHVDKVYYARVSGILPSDIISHFEKGVVLEDGVLTMPAKLELQTPEDGITPVLLTIHEGKFHQVKRMFEAVGCQVIYLKRLRMGTLVLDEALQPVDYRKLTAAELDMLKNNRS